MASTLLIRNLQMQNLNNKHTTERDSKSFKTDSFKVIMGYVPGNKM